MSEEGKEEDLFTKKANYHIGLSKYNLDSDKRHGKITPEEYQKIVEEGVSCARCSILVKEHNYGTTDSDGETKKTLCRSCISIQGL